MGRWLVCLVIAIAPNAYAKRLQCPVEAVAPVPAHDSDTRPIPPRHAELRFSHDPNAVTVTGTYGPTTAFLRVTIHDPNGTVHEVVTTPDRPYACTDFVLVAGATSSIVAIDRDGNESAPVIASIHRAPVSGFLGAIIALVATFSALFFGVVVLIVVRILQMRRATGYDVTVASAEAIADRIAHRALARSITACALIAVWLIGGFDMWICYPLILLFAVYSLEMLAAARAVRRDLAEPNANVQLCGRKLVVSGTSMVVVPKRLLEQTGLPIAIARPPEHLLIDI